jgi:hypothetical protein
MIPQLQK